MDLRFLDDTGFAVDIIASPIATSLIQVVGLAMEMQYGRSLPFLKRPALIPTLAIGD